METANNPNSEEKSNRFRTYETQYGEIYLAVETAKRYNMINRSRLEDKS